MPMNLILVGADKGGVGKTTVTRILLDYLERKSVAIRPIDSEIGEVGLRRFWPQSTPIDAADAREQPLILDGLSEKDTTVVDLRAGILSPFMRDLTDMGFINDAKNGSLKLTVLQVVGAGSASVSEVGDMVSKVPAASHLLVRSHASAAAVFPELGDRQVIDVPNLADVAVEAVDQAAQSYEAFVADSKNSLTLRRRVRHWLDQVYTEFDKAKVAG